MKFIVIGLGTLGFSIAKILTNQGEDVIGVDMNLSRVEEYKNDISNTICMNVREYHALSSLPIKDVDAVIVAIGNDMSTSIEVVAYVKQLGAKKIFARSNSAVETAILKAIGIDRIMNPSEYAAEIYSFDVRSASIQGLYKIDKEFRLYEWLVPNVLNNQEIKNIDFLEQFHMQLIAVKRLTEETNLLGIKSSDYQVLSNLSPEMKLLTNDQLVLFGKEKDFAKMNKALY